MEVSERWVEGMPVFTHRERRGQIGQIAQHRAQAKQWGSDVAAGAARQGMAERREDGKGRAERRDT